MTEGAEHLGLRPRIAMAIGTICLASSILVLGYLHWALERSALAQWQQERLADAGSLATALDKTIKELTGDLRLAVATPPMTRLGFQNRVERRLNGIPLGVDMEKRRVLDTVLEEGAFSVLFILQPNGDHYLSHPYDVQTRLSRFNLADRPYIREAARTGLPTVSDSFIGADGEPAVVIDVPRLDDSGQVVFHLGGVIHLRRLTELFGTTVTDRFDVALLVDRKGAVIAGSGDPSVRPPSWDSLAAALRRFQAESNEPGHATIRTVLDPDRNDEMVAALVTLKSGWAMALARGRSTFLEQARPEIARISLIAAGLLLVVGVIGFAIASHMAGRWETARRALAEAHDALEDRVRSRTADLDQSRRELESKSNTLETILENVSHGISLFGADLRLVACNGHFADLLSLPPDLARVGTPLAAVLLELARRGEYGPGDPGILATERLAMFTGDQPHLSQRISTNGKVLEVVVNPLPEGGFVIAHTDISEAKRAEEDLRTLSRAVEQSPVSVVITDPAGNIEYVNPKFVEITGYGLDEVKGLNPRILKSGEVPDDTYRDLWQTITSGATWEGDLRNRRKSGDMFWERASISPIRSPSGEVIHYLAVKEDITARKQAEAEIMAAWQAAEEANRAKTVFLSHMSHELRTPLTAVLGYAEMMNVQIAGPLPPVYADYVETIMSSGRHLLSIIDEVLDISRIELGSFRIASFDMDLCQLAKECAAMMRPQCNAKEINLAVSAEATATIHSDERALRQILINLLANAVKYTDFGGSITVEAAATADGGGQVVVRDSGCGIPADKLGRIFEPFQRVDPLRADPARGVGLGLAICRRIVDLLGGTISLASETGRGTIVTVTLPPSVSAATDRPHAKV
ncbi:histidine kinase [Paramagnetospirillum marisnigri]|uniref:histidine kinase n=1 Tax=Paramagnetospirillum marisnigri TaxID=1285242 RepID=A0A178M9C6_9PROT|nr:PAS-domain containing protein [Paramagnetospirillum marisnigri]OAN44817.1 histidine kinase [Paramagnetospirillum marisnigri]